MTRRVFVFVFFLLVACHVAHAAARPNIIVFLADDMGWGDLACYGHPVMKTPNLDRFATQGLRLTSCYSASSVCSPSRSAILTGRTPYRNGVFTWIPENRDIHLRTSEITIARLLKERGYATCHVGKWHLNGKFNSTEQPQPDDHGFDWWFGTQNNAAPNHRSPTNFVRNGKPVGPLAGFSATLVAEEGIRWLRQHRDPTRPFFMSVWTHEPHLPIESDPKFMALYSEIDNEDLRQHHGNISQLDHAFGLLMNTLDDMKLAEDTLVIFTSDNGPEGNGRKGRTRGSTGGLRGRKRSMYEGGIRVPGIVRWPGHIRPHTLSDEPVIGSDIFTTICDVLDIPLPADRTIDGASMMRVFAGQPIHREVPLYWRWFNAPGGVQMAMRRGDLKIVADEGLTRFELYDLAGDPHEEHDLTASNPEKLRSMKEGLLALNASIEKEGPDWWRGYRTRTRQSARGLHVTAFLAALRGVGSEGRGNVRAALALERYLERTRPQEIPTLLAGINSAGPLAANWIRAAIDTIAEGPFEPGGSLPAKALEAFVRDRSHAPDARWLAHDLLLRADPDAGERLVPGMLDDPGVEFRRLAVTRLLQRADGAGEKDDDAAAVALYRQALGAARDDDQIRSTANKLRDLGQEVDLARHFGFLMRWKVIGPFDNTGRAGLDTAFPPEESIDLDAEYDGKIGRVRWTDFATTEELGHVDLNRAVAHMKEVTGYAFTEFTSAAGRQIDLRLATANAFKLWVNGELAYARNEYHHGTSIDHYRAHAALRAGPNAILLKVCQDNSTPDYADKWKFQIRVCDATGTAVLSTTRAPTVTGAKAGGK